MCFYISKNPKYSNEKIARKDIPILKVLRREGHTFLAPYMAAFKYFDDRTKKQEIKYSTQLSRIITVQHTIWDRSCITDGFHSYTTDYQINTDNYIVNAYIPKGAKYYFNPYYKEYVSNEIVIYTAKEKRIKFRNY